MQKILRCLRVVRCRHNARKRLYREIDDRDPLTIPFLVLSPSCAWYVKKVVFQTDRYFFRDWHSVLRKFASNDYRRFFTGWRLKRLKLLMKKSPLIPIILREQWLSWLVKGEDRLLKLLLLSMVPNLTSLTVTRHEDWSIFVEVFSNVMETDCFPNLSEVRLNHSLTNDQNDNFRLPQNLFDISMATITPFLALPALKTFSIGHSGPWSEIPEYECLWEHHGRRSTILDLDLGDMDINPVDFDEFFGGIIALRSFRLSYAPLEVLDSLMKHQAQSLEVLQIDSWDLGPNHETLPSLSTFPVLRSVTLDYSHLVVG